MSTENNKKQSILHDSPSGMIKECNIQISINHTNATIEIPLKAPHLFCLKTKIFMLRIFCKFRDIMEKQLYKCNSCKREVIINPIERYNEDVKQRYKVMRFKSLELANAFLNLRRIIYNFVRGDESRAVKAGISLELGQNRLLHLIKF